MSLASSSYFPSLFLSLRPRFPFHPHSPLQFLCLSLSNVLFFSVALNFILSPFNTNDPIYLSHCSLRVGSPFPSLGTANPLARSSFRHCFHAASSLLSFFARFAFQSISRCKLELYGRESWICREFIYVAASRVSEASRATPGHWLLPFIGANRSYRLLYLMRANIELSVCRRTNLLQLCIS